MADMEESGPGLLNSLYARYGKIWRAHLADAHKGCFAGILVWRLDRLGRSLRHLVTVVEDLLARAGSRSSQPPIPTWTPRLQRGDCSATSSPPWLSTSGR